MSVVTITCPIGLEHQEVLPDAPIWVDSLGNEYRVASGIIEGIEPTEFTVATPDKITVVVGVDGVTALAMMGLIAKGFANER